MCHEAEHEAVEKALPPHVRVAYDGMQVEVAHGEVRPGVKRESVDLVRRRCSGRRGPPRADDLAKSVVIVYNVEDPDSRPLADYYALKRGVPTSQICEIDVRAAETITRAEYNQKIRDPISRFLVSSGPDPSGTEDDFAIRSSGISRGWERSARRCPASC